MRYYSSTTGAMTLTAGVGASDTTIAVNTVVGLPVSFPYTLVIEPGVAGQEEIVTVTAAAGSTLTVTRGEDSTTGVTHDLGSSVRHMMTARDLREAREHEAETTGAHGITGAPVGDTDVQTLDGKTFQSSGTGTPLTVRQSATQTDPVFVVKTSAGNNSFHFLNGAATWTASAWGDSAWIRNGDSAFFFKVTAQFSAPDVDVVPLVLKAAASQTADLQQWKNSAGTNLARVTPTGAIVSPTITALADADVALDVRLDALEAQTLDTRLDAVEANLGSQTTFVASSAAKDGKRIHWGTATTAVPDANGFATVTHGAGFTPTVVQVQSTSPASLFAVAVGVDTITATTFRVRFYGWNTGASYSAAAVPISFTCME